jgi:SAM-dependent methyltransferase
MIPDWQLPPGVDRGLWDYLHSGEMAAGYDGQMETSPLAGFDVRFCERHFPAPGRLLDVGCGTGRCAAHFAAHGYSCVGLDLSAEMLAVARTKSTNVEWIQANIVDPFPTADGSFDYAACLFSTLGMVRGDDARRRVLANVRRAVRPGGVFVLHVHNRYFRRLGVRGWRAGDVTMPQAYAGAPLTLRHFGRREATGLLRAAGFARTVVRPLAITGELPYPWLLPEVRSYGYLIVAT